MSGLQIPRRHGRYDGPVPCSYQTGHRSQGSGQPYLIYVIASDCVLFLLDRNTPGFRHIDIFLIVLFHQPCQGAGPPGTRAGRELLQEVMASQQLTVGLGSPGAARSPSSSRTCIPGAKEAGAVSGRACIWLPVCVQTMLITECQGFTFYTLGLFLSGSDCIFINSPTQRIWLKKRSSLLSACMN